MTLLEKQQNAREWIQALNTDDPGEWWMEENDMELIKEALSLWLKHQENYKPSIQVIIDGTPYEVK